VAEHTFGEWKVTEKATEKKDGRKASSVLFALNRRLSARNSPSIARFPAIGYTELIKDVRTL
jgi:hypothetical protein